MQGFTSYLVDQNVARHAVELCLPMINSSMDSREAGASGFLYIVIMRPGVTPAHGNFSDSILYEHAVGDRAKWDADYGVFARAKAELSWRSGLDSHRVQQDRPYMLAEGDSLLWGGVVIHDIVVAVSGADPWFDEAFAGSIIMFLRALAKKGLAEQGNKSWLGKS
ncbi:MAG TPA: hypothetical protein VFF74_09390 [Methylophilaceae bacterium]|nr:hypothetical protein [Methylophilaceae bacterium]